MVRSQGPATTQPPSWLPPRRSACPRAGGAPSGMHPNLHESTKHRRGALAHCDATIRGNDGYEVAMRSSDEILRKNFAFVARTEDGDESSHHRPARVRGRGGDANDVAAGCHSPRSRGECRVAAIGVDVRSPSHANPLRSDRGRGEACTMASAGGLQ